MIKENIFDPNSRKKKINRTEIRIIANFSESMQIKRYTMEASLM
jgi:hypothetical protein